MSIPITKYKIEYYFEKDKQIHCVGRICMYESLCLLLRPDYKT
jgi:hypothetical protein